MDDELRVAATCDIGGTKVLQGLVNESGVVFARERYLLGEQRDPQCIAEDMFARWRRLAHDSGLSWRQVVGVGCSAAAMIDIERGVLLSAPNMFPGYEDVPFRDLLQRTTGLPSVVEMDAYAAAIGEFWQGAGVGVGYFVYVVVGTGIGAGILVDGEVFRGYRGTAGELGHTTVLEGGPLCNCGRYGCLEALASGPAIVRRAEGALRQGRGSSMVSAADTGTLTPRVIFDAAHEGDRVAAGVVQATVGYLAAGLVNVLHVLNPEVIALGGGVITGGEDLLLRPLRQEVADRCGSWIDRQGIRIVMASLGEDASLVGAARLVFQRCG